MAVVVSTPGPNQVLFAAIATITTSIANAPAGATQQKALADRKRLMESELIHNLLGAGLDPGAVLSSCSVPVSAELTSKIANAKTVPGAAGIQTQVASLQRQALQTAMASGAVSAAYILQNATASL